MGVRGFLISCAMRRATSLQAAARCAFSSSDKSSMTRTTPAPEPLTALRVVAVSATGIEPEAEPRFNRLCSATRPARRARFNKRFDGRRKSARQVDRNPRRSKQQQERHQTQRRQTEQTHLALPLDQMLIFAL